MRIWLKPERMAALNICPTQVRDALAKNNFLAAVGNTKGSLLQVNLTANTDLHTVDEFKQLVVKQDKGTLVRLGDIADVVLGAEDYNTEVRFSGQQAVFMGILVLPNANSIDVIKRVRAEMEQIQKELPTGMQAEIAYDATAYINDAIHEVFKTLIETLLIVMVVIFLFLGSLRSVLVPVVAIPISLIGALFLMQVFGFTLNLLTLLAIVLSVGLVVDDAIVVVENVERHMREGMSRAERGAARRARTGRPDHRDDDHARRGLHADRAARRIDRHALPRICVHACRRRLHFRRRRARSVAGDVGEVAARRNRWKRGFSGFVNRTFDRFRDWYGRHLDRTLARASGRLYGLDRPDASRGDLFVVTMSPREGARADGRSGRHLRHHDRAGERDHRRHDPLCRCGRQSFSAVPDTRFTFQLTFPGNGFGGMVLKPWGVRKKPSKNYLPQVQQKLGGIPGIQMFPAMPPAFPGADNFPVEIRYHFDRGAGAHARVCQADPRQGDGGANVSVFRSSTRRSTSRRPKWSSITTRSRRSV